LTLLIGGRLGLPAAFLFWYGTKAGERLTRRFAGIFLKTLVYGEPGHASGLPVSGIKYRNIRYLILIISFLLVIGFA